MSTQKIPRAVINEASPLLDMYKGHIVYLGKYEAYDAYCIEFDEPVIIGPPEVYLYRNGKAEAVGDPICFDVLEAFR